MQAVFFYDTIRPMAKKKTIIVMMGGPGVGKGTFSQMLMQRHPFNYIEAGAMLRAEPADSEIGRLISVGNLVPDDLVCDLIRDKINSSSDIILDGFPRTIGQATWLAENYAKTHDIHILYFYAPDSVLIERIKKRIRDGSHRRDDSNISIIRHRLDNFHTITMPAIQWLRTAPGIKFSEIDADGDVSDNFCDILSALPQYK